MFSLVRFDAGFVYGPFAWRLRGVNLSACAWLVHECRLLGIRIDGGPDAGCVERSLFSITRDTVRVFCPRAGALLRAQVLGAAYLDQSSIVVFSQRGHLAVCSLESVLRLRAPLVVRCAPGSAIVLRTAVMRAWFLSQRARAHRRLAVAMAMHWRLGAQSGFRHMDPCIVANMEF